MLWGGGGGGDTYANLYLTYTVYISSDCDDLRAKLSFFYRNERTVFREVEKLWLEFELKLRPASLVAMALAANQCWISISAGPADPLVRGSDTAQDPDPSLFLQRC
jgi:hypothetical protein